ncbi:ABC transporter substrate-binding protein [Cryptosporangium sp. NPDC048952]|uniref:ABC transporter substrate-binding protein n=1 Tax=Cryptosporangium sp. NPDC048952 TaxID=3363961 RepID=UPI003716EE13
MATGLVAVVALVSGCTDSGKEVTASSDGMRTVRIAQPFTSTLNSGLLVADGLGYFKKKNITLKFTDVANGAGLQTTLGGSADVALASSVLPVTALTQSQKFTVFAAIGNGFPESVIVDAKAYAASGLKDDSPLADKIKFLANKPFGISSPTGSTAYVMKYLFKLAGQPAGAFKPVTLGSGPAILAALKSGKVIGGSIGSPYPQVAESEGYAHIFLNVPGGEVPQLTNILTSVLAVTPDFYKNNKPLLDDFVAALREGQQYVYAHPSESDDFVYTHYFAKSPKAAVLAGVTNQRNGGAIAKTPDINKESVDHLVEFMRATGQKVPDSYSEIFVGLT